ncbi:MAG: DUF2442 domain-containing protein [Brevundimonas sp.]|uniref:DUF2442 domain-containing protein n=1 Tax=Brevundimonas sp. TaxID=1871086 RepID=UPI0027346010|nr:DUF2442 domain-containing protein [Brevundimonas sp.]MDP3406404.1 DUF2442 domain-containing protein [Brevundimonas sp.]
MNEFKMVRARRVRALPDAQLEIEFDNATMGVVDLSDFVMLGPVTEPLRDPAFFARVFVEMGVPTWPNGCDLDPINAQMRMREAGTLRAVSATA